MWCSDAWSVCVCVCMYVVCGVEVCGVVVHGMCVYGVYVLYDFTGLLQAPMGTAVMNCFPEPVEVWSSALDMARR